MIIEKHCGDFLDMQARLARLMDAASRADMSLEFKQFGELSAASIAALHDIDVNIPLNPMSYDDVLATVDPATVYASDVMLSIKELPPHKERVLYDRATQTAWTSIFMDVIVLLYWLYAAAAICKHKQFAGGDVVSWLKEHMRDLTTDDIYNNEQLSMVAAMVSAISVATVVPFSLLAIAYCTEMERWSNQIDRMPRPSMLAFVPLNTFGQTLLGVDVPDSTKN